MLADTQAVATPSSPVVATVAGRVAGTREHGVEVFRGLPYAAPPVGARRWRAPAPVAPWTGIRPATTFGNDCMQDSASNPMEPGHAVPASEDCLYLNLWRPAGTTATPAARHRPLPVMVWIHGGAFIMGAGSMAAYDGSALARGGAIVVTLNYRLGRFGTFVTPALAAEQAAHGEPAANFWLMDQIAALRWVKANVARFGGDPQRITVFGESAGAVSVATLMAVVPHAAPGEALFARAMIQSGSPRKALVPLVGSPLAAQERGRAWAQGKGVVADDPAALRALPAPMVLDAPVTTVNEPVQDGVLLREPPWETFRAGRMARVPVVIGANSEEESLLRWMPGAATALERRMGARAAEGLALHGAATLGHDAALARLWGEVAMVEPARATARVLAGHGLPVWLYHFAYVPEALRAVRRGVGHADEIEFVFATPSAASRPGWSAADAATAAGVSARWLAFARNGRPDIARPASRPGREPLWPPLTTGADRLLVFTAQGPVVRRDFAREQLDFAGSVAVMP